MTQKQTSTKTVLETVLDWSETRPLWQRDALRRIVSKGKLDADDVSELVALCKKGRGATDIAVEGQPLSKSHLPANPGKGQSVALLSLSDAEGVNNLAGNQELAFGADGLTVIYGDNGAGKSGYARVLKRACRARHSGQIYSNIYDDDSDTPPSASLTYSVGGSLLEPERWEDSDQPHSVLSAISVFDSSCASVHIREPNEVAYRPFGLDVPDELAGACLAVKDALSQEKKKLADSQDPIFLKPTWSPHTDVGKSLGSLKSSTDVKKIEALAGLDAEEAKRLEQLREDLSKDPSKAAAEQRRRAESINGLITAVQAAAGSTSNESLATLQALYRDARTKRQAAEAAAQAAFADDSLPGTGGEVWRLLWESARRYATEVAYPNEAYPPSAESETRCVLCQQPLEAEALARMAKFEEFIQRDTEKQAAEAERIFKAARKQLVGFDPSILRVRANYRELLIASPTLARKTMRFLAAARLRRWAVLRAIQSDKDAEVPASAESPADGLNELKADVRRRAVELDKAADGVERKKLEAEAAALADRTLLTDLLPIVHGEIERLKTIAFLDKCLSETPTNAITNLGNHVADTVVTPKLRDRFQEEIVKLAAEKVRVEIVRAGGKYGSPQYRVRMFAKPEAQVGEILSEGEQTCVGLAAFLTELATASHTSTLVFDDPVSSLDHRWRKQVAKRLVEEAAHRQVIVFTHDIVFVNDLSDLADEEKRPFSAVTVVKGPVGAGVVKEGLPWIAGKVEDRIDKLEKAARAAQKLHDADDEEGYRVEAGSIYDNLRASWERALETIAFGRVVQRHRDYIDPKRLKAVTVLTEADCDAFAKGYKHCCDVVDAHDPSGGRNAPPPPPKDMFADIKELKDWVESLRERQKKVA